MTGPKISVVMLSFNHARYVTDAIRSVWAQPYGNLELVVSDDCSSDGSQDVLHELASASPIPMKVICNEKNIGINANLNQAIRQASGDYIAFCSSDDLLASDRFQEQSNALCNDESLQIVYANGRIFTEAGTFGRVHGPEVISLLQFPATEILRYLYTNVSPLYLQTVLVRKNFLIECRGYDERVLADDWVMNIRFFERLSKTGRHSYIDQDVCLYRMHATNQYRDTNRHTQLMKQVVRAYTPSQLKKEANSNIFWAISENHRHSNRRWSGLIYFFLSAVNKPEWTRWAQVVDQTPALKFASSLLRNAKFGLFGRSEIARIEQALTGKFGELDDAMFTNRHSQEIPPSAGDPEAQLGPLFDRTYFAEQYPELAADSTNFAATFLALGASRRLDPNAFFDAGYYLEKYPDVASANLNPLLHYVKYGAQEGRDPHPLFSTTYYNRTNPVVEAMGLNPLLHYLAFGAARGRTPHPSLRWSSIFRALSIEARKDGGKVASATLCRPA
jgi:glycosyltransferase involved in cell wall biosynthesis